MGFAYGCRERLECDILISAVGRLHHPRYPEIEGLEIFAGTQFHTARWPEAISLKRKRVGLIGTGSTATQIIAAVADEVQRLTIFQRTAQWVVPVPNPPISWWRRLIFRLDPVKLAQHTSASRTFIEENASNIAHGRGKKELLAACTAVLR